MKLSLGRVARVAAPAILALALVATFLGGIPFWRGLTILMGLAGSGAAWALARGERPVPAPRWADLALGGGLAIASWALATLVLTWTQPWFPALGDGLRFLADAARREPPAWRYAGVLVIAIGEELFWRGYLPCLWGGREGYARPRAQALAVLPYVGLHLLSGRIFLALPALCFGAAWGQLTAWRRAPWAAIAWHIGFDLGLFLWFPPAGV